MCVCVYIYMQCVMYLEARGWYQVSSSNTLHLKFLRQGLTLNLKLTDDWPVGSRDLHTSASLVLGLQLSATLPTFHVVLGIQTQVSCLWQIVYRWSYFSRPLFYFLKARSLPLPLSLCATCGQKRTSDP